MMPHWAKKLDWDLISQVANAHELDRDLVAAVVQVESAGNTYACRYEPNFRWVYQVAQMALMVRSTSDTMVFMQKTSWGLMQVMGAVAYEHKLHTRENKHERWPTALLNPWIGMEYGCLHLKQKEKQYGSDPTVIYAAYNAGSPRHNDKGEFVNQKNVDRFLRYYDELS